MTLFRGLCAFPITPADPHGHVDTAALRRILAPLLAPETALDFAPHLAPDLVPDFAHDFVSNFARNAAGDPALSAEQGLAASPDAICVLGSTGTYAYLDRAQRRRTIEAAIAEASGRTPILAGIGALRTDHAVQFAQDAQHAGAAGVLLAPMSYTRLTGEEVLAHFAAVSAAITIPICIYDNPGTTGFSFTPALLHRLAALPNVAAIKTPAPATNLSAGHAAWRAAAPAGFPIGYSVDWNAAEALLAGGDAWYSVAAGLFPHACQSLATAALAGDAPAARAANARLQPLWDLFTEHSSLRVMYAAAQIMGFTGFDPPLPILPVSADVRARLQDTIALLE